MIAKDWRSDLHAYMGGIVKGINGVPLAVGGIEDHAHLLIGLRATHRLDYVLRDIKADSSSWVHTTVGQKKFEWQSGYLGLSVSPSQKKRSGITSSIKRNTIVAKVSKRNTSSFEIERD